MAPAAPRSENRAQDTGFCGRSRLLPPPVGGQDLRPDGPHAGPQGEADTGPPVGDGRYDAGGACLHAGTPGVAQRLAQRRVPGPPDAGGDPAAAGHLGRLADPPPNFGPGLRMRHTRQGAAGGPAGLRPRPEPVGRGRVEPPQERGDAEPRLPGPGGVASGVPSGGCPPAAEGAAYTFVLRTSRIGDAHYLNFFMQRSVKQIPNYDVGNLVATDHRPDWIPGDAGFIKNTGVPSDDAHIGENIIYLGNNKWWGHFGPGGDQKTKGDWMNVVAGWGQPGGAEESDQKSRPSVGISG